DERDVILFSITYGPDQSGYVSMNFGPLNQAGGERRLNVALTRARYEMLVFSTLRPDHIDLSRTQARAVADLKRFLEYAQRGPSVLGKDERGSVGDFESPFEEAVARALTDRGWKVLPQIGVSKYRIDLGVVHPAHPGRFLAGVECDGASYHSSKYARERDKIRQQVLERLGWRLFRVWSTDWWINPSLAVDRLDRELREHLAQERAGVENHAHARQSAFQIDLQPARDASTTPQADVAAREERYALFDNAKSSQELIGDDQARFVYVEASFNMEEHAPDPERFYHQEYTSLLASMIEHVIDIEGPIHEEVLVRRIARHHGFKRSGRKIRDRIIGLAKRNRPHTTEGVGTFFWPERHTTGQKVPARYKGRSQEMRDVWHICDEEIRAIDEILDLQGDTTKVARAIGIARLREAARTRLEAALKGNN
ncbi:DUF3320 domain-containing protein, partial [Oceanithermus desulfurans]